VLSPSAIWLRAGSLKPSKLQLKRQPQADLARK
jgi:hypothetical protein